MTEKQREKDMDALRSDITSLREHIASLAVSVRKLAEEKAGESASESGQEEPKHEGTAFGEQWHSVWADFQRKLEEAGVRGEKAVKELIVEMERHPLGSIAAAFGIGFIIAKLLDRGKKA